MIKKLIAFLRRKAITPHQHKWERDGDLFLKCSCGAEAVYFGDQSNVEKDEVKGWRFK